MNLNVKSFLVIFDDWTDVMTDQHKKNVSKKNVRSLMNRDGRKEFVGSWCRRRGEGTESQMDWSIGM